MSLYYIESNDELKGYDIMKKDWKLDEDGKTSDYRVATVYDPDTIDLLLGILDAEDKRPIEGFVIESNDEPEEDDETPVG